MTVKDEKGIIVVVTYNRLELLRKTIELLINQTVGADEIIVVNNASTDGTFEFLQDLEKRNSRIYVENMIENMGGAGGFSKGIELAYSHGADWIWGMDDDAFADKDALKHILEIRKSVSVKDAYWSNIDGDEEFDKPYKKVSGWTFVGFFIGRNIVDKIGLPRDDFFIYYDDYEYANRIISNGFSIFKVKDSIIHHKDAPSNKIDVNLFGKKIEIMLMPKQPWKTYYLIRNDLLRHDKSSSEYKKSVQRSHRRILKSIFVSKEVFMAAIKGAIDGKRGIAGKVMKP